MEKYLNQDKAKKKKNPKAASLVPSAFVWHGLHFHKGQNVEQKAYYYAHLIGKGNES